MGSCFSKHPSLLEIQGASKHPEGVTKRIQEQQPVAQPVAAGPVIHFTLVLSDGQHIEVSTPGSDPVSILPQMVVDGASDAEPLELSDLLSVSLADGALWQSGTKPACPTLLTGGVPEIAKGQPTLAACGVMDQVSFPPFAPVSQALSRCGCGLQTQLTVQLVYPTAAQVSAEEARLKAEEARLGAEQEAAVARLEAEQEKELDCKMHKLFDLVCRDGSGTICKDEFEVFVEHLVSVGPKRIEMPQSLMAEEVRQLQLHP